MVNRPVGSFLTKTTDRPYLETLKQAEVKVSANPQRIQKYAPNTALRLFVRDPESLDEVVGCTKSVPEP